MGMINLYPRISLF